MRENDYRQSTAVRGSLEPSRKVDHGFNLSDNRCKTPRTTKKQERFSSWESYNNEGPVSVNSSWSKGLQTNKLSQDSHRSLSPDGTIKNLDVPKGIKREGIGEKFLVRPHEQCNTSNKEKQLPFYTRQVLEQLKLSRVAGKRQEQHFPKFNFVDDIQRCSQEYFPDLRLQPCDIKLANEIYHIANNGSKIEFTVIGRISGINGRETESSNEKYPFLDSTLRQNLLGHDNLGKSAIILRLPDKQWNILSNMSWILGLVHAFTEFHLSSNITKNNIWNSQNNLRTFFAVELMSIISSGYELHKTKYEVVAVCIDKKKAQTATLRTLIEATQPLFNYDNLKEFYRSLPDEVKSEE